KERLRAITFQFDDRLGAHHEATLRKSRSGGDRQDGRALEAAMREVVQGAIRLLEWIRMDVGANRDPRRDLQEFFAVPPSQVGDRADMPLHPEELVGK